VTLNLADMTVVKSRPSVPYGANYVVFFYPADATVYTEQADVFTNK